MLFSGRPASIVMGAAFKRCHYVAAVNMFRVYRKPFEMFRRYLLGQGTYPAVVEVKSPIGELSLNVYSAHDVVTVNEVFCRRDYRAERTDRIFVDFGSNIGISAAYFLSRNSDGFAYLFEPLARNIERLKRNLTRFEGRYELHEVAVGEQEGQVEFGWEETGRYGGVGKRTGQYVSVPCVDSNDALEQILSKHGRIDVLKIDIEALERQITERIPAKLAANILKLFVEFPFEANPLQYTHSHRRYSSVAQFFRLAETPARETIDLTCDDKDHPTARSPAHASVDPKSRGLQK
jgi:FkbM family methyltransferase